MILNLETIKRIKDAIIVIVLAVICFAIIDLPKDEIFWQSGLDGRYIVSEYINEKGQRDITVVKQSKDNISKGLFYYGFVFLILLTMYLGFSRLEELYMIEIVKNNQTISSRKFARELRRVR